MDIYVAPGGNDIAADGTPGRPFKTIQRAVWAVGNNFTVWINSGSYSGNVDTGGKVDGKSGG